jgi:tetratricopeptide (TPR) repeat protein
MARRLRGVWLALAAVLLVGAAPDPEAEDLVRRGNAAFARGDFAEAAGLYQQAEERTTDPGLVAFNKAAALYSEKEYDRAEGHYWLCLGDAGPRVQRWLQKSPGEDLPADLRRDAGPRLSRVLYNLGNCLLQRSQGKDADLVEQAAVLYDHSLRLGDGGATLRADARHNLELAKEFLRLNPRPPKKDQSSTNPKEDGQKPKKDRQGSDSGEDGTDPNRDRTGSKPTDQRPDGSEDPQATNERRPGKGNLEPLADDDKLPTMSSADADRYLQVAVERILKERRDYQEKTAGKPSSHVQDW